MRSTRFREEAINSWILAGYQEFASDGPNGLKVERLSRKVGKNKSSFYHYFADLEVYTNHLLRYHLRQAEVLAEREAKCQNVNELIEIILDHQLDLFFNRQLRINRSNPDFDTCFEQTNQITIPGFLKIWKKIIGLPDQTELAASFLQLSMGHFFLSMTPDDMNRKWLTNYFHQLFEMVEAFKRNGKIPAMLNGTV
ncbi:MAG: TetR/AcrR family transcriptional regulator [Bacteroidota bacterium]